MVGQLVNWGTVAFGGGRTGQDLRRSAAPEQYNPPKSPLFKLSSLPLGGGGGGFNKI